jgi:hypothetical protein
MSRRVLAKLLGVGAVVLASTAILLALEDQGAPTAAAPPAPQAEAEPVVEVLLPPPLPPPPVAEPRQAPGRAAPAQLARPAAVVPQAGPWEAIAPVPAASWPELTSAFEQARPRLAPCFDADVQARYGPRPFSALGQPRVGTGAAVVLVELESLGGGRVRVVGAPVEVRGAAEDGLLSCFQEQVRGLELRGHGERGARYRVRYALVPMTALPEAPFVQPRVRTRH